MVEAIKKVQPAVPTQAIKRQVKRQMRRSTKEASSRKPEMKKTFKIEKWAKGIFHFNDVPGGTLKCTVQGEKKEFKDGDEYTEPLSVFEDMNEDCRVVKREYRPGGEGQVGVWAKTKRYEPRLWWEIRDKWDKKITFQVPVTQEEKE